MTATNPHGPEGTPSSSPTIEMQENAKSIVEQRFRNVQHRDESIKALARIGLERLLKEMQHPVELAPKSLPKLLDHDGLQALDPMEILRDESQLPALPQVFIELQQALGASATSSDDLAAIISQDPSLTAFLLRMVNSVFYSLPTPIDTITRAVTVVGVNQLSTLAVGSSVLTLFDEMPDNLVNMRRFWKHSVAVGIIARRIGTALGKGLPERTFVAGLLHDIGQLVLLKTVPERLADAIVYAQSESLPVSEAERIRLGFDHATLGGMLLRKWNFPYVLVCSVLEHHAPKKKQKEVEPGLIHCAEFIAAALGLSAGGEMSAQTLDQATWESMNFTPTQLEEMLTDLDEELDEAFHIMLDT